MIVIGTVTMIMLIFLGIAIGMYIESQIDKRLWIEENIMVVPLE